MKKVFEFKKQRNFDDIIESSFRFFRLHIKKIIQIFWKYNKITTLGLFISYFFYNYYAFQLTNFLFGVKNKNIESGAVDSLWLGLVNLVFVVFSFIFFVRFVLTIFGYIKSYIKNEGQIKEKEVMDLVNTKFWPFVGASFLLVLLLIIIIVLGTLFFLGFSKMGSFGVAIAVLLFLPLVFYIITFMNLYFQVYIFDEVSASEAISLTMSYLKDKFWFSFLVTFVLGIIIWLLGMVFNAPILIYSFIKGLMLAKDPDVINQMTQGDLFISFFSLISLAGETVLKVLSVIGGVILYYTLKEYHTNEGLLEKLERLNAKNNNDESQA